MHIPGGDLNAVHQPLDSVSVTSPACWPWLNAHLSITSDTLIAADHMGHYMVHVFSQMYKMRELFHAADVKSKMKEAERFQGAPKQEVVFTKGDRDYYYHEPPKKGVVSGNVLLLWLVLMRALCSSSMVVV